jgi:hypothetical protein
MGAAAPEPLERRASVRLGGVADFLEQESILLVIGLLYAAALLVRLPYTLGADSWLTFVGGRFVREHGLPHADVLTAWSHGVTWVDQQWLAQLVFEASARAGGVKLALLVHAALVVGAFAVAAAAARRLGAGSRAVALVAVLVVPELAEAWELRAQSFAYPLFVAVLWLVLADARRPGRGVLLCLPLLVIWTNLHGSVLAGAALVSLHGLIRLRSSGRSAVAAVTAFGPWVALFASPYATDLPAYYAHVLVGRNFSSLVTEWGPATPSFMTGPFYALAFGGVALLARGWARVLPFERGAFFVTLVAGVLGLRNMVWFSLVAFLVLPRLLHRELEATARDEAQRRMKIVVAAAAAGAAAIVAVVAVARPAAAYERAYPPALADRVAAAAAAHPGYPVFADVAYGDWLLWKHPSLRGRVAFDARLELLSKRRLASLYDWKSHIGDGWWRIPGCPSVVVVDRTQNRTTLDLLVRERGARVAYRDRSAAVVIRPRSACP